MNSLTHFDAAGRAQMVDVGDKAVTHRVAVATGRISMLPATLQLISSGSAKKGDVLRSRELGTAVVMLAGAAFLQFAGPWLLGSMQEALRHARV